MNRSAIVKLSGTSDELRNLLLEAISRKYGVTVQTCDFNEEKQVFEFSCLEGLQAGKMPEVSANVIPEMFGRTPKRSGAHKNRGLKSFLETLFTEYDRIPFDKLVEDCRKSGYKLANNQLKWYMKQQIGVVELDPDVFGLKK